MTERDIDFRLTVKEVDKVAERVSKEYSEALKDYGVACDNRRSKGKSGEADQQVILAQSDMSYCRGVEAGLRMAAGQIPVVLRLRGGERTVLIGSDLEAKEIKANQEQQGVINI